MIRYFFIEKEKIIPARDSNLENITWCDAVRPTEDELMEISQKFNIDIEDLEDCFDETERPRFKVDLLLNYNFILLQIPISEELDINQDQATYPLGFFLTANKKIITVHSMVSPIFEKIVETINRRAISDYLFLIIEIFHSIVNEMDTIAKKFIFYIREIQNSVLHSQKGSDIKKPFQLNSYLILYTTAIFGDLNSIKSFYNKNKNVIDGNIALFDKYEDMLIDMEQMYNLTSTYQDVLANSLDAFSSVINNNITTIMKIVASISLIVSIPTLVASIFGMNVYFPGINILKNDIIPFLLIISITSVSTALIWIYFRKVKWL